VEADDSVKLRLAIIAITAAYRDAGRALPPDGVSPFAA
jgi:hypothetical protein